jgi:hypothetical protein
LGSGAFVGSGGEVSAGDGVGVVCDVGWGSGGDEFAAVRARFWADVDDPVALGDDGHVVLDDEDGVASVSKVLKDGDEFVSVVGWRPMEGSSRM